jgi:hypothetical protein
MSQEELLLTGAAYITMHLAATCRGTSSSLVPMQCAATFVPQCVLAFIFCLLPLASIPLSQVSFIIPYQFQPLKSHQYYFKEGKSGSVDD